MKTLETRPISKGDKVSVCGERVGIVESVATYCVSGEVSMYYVLWLKKDGTIGKRANWVHPENVQGVR